LNSGNTDDFQDGKGEQGTGLIVVDQVAAQVEISFTMDQRFYQPNTKSYMAD
jgi:hypothetical protein